MKVNRLVASAAAAALVMLLWLLVQGIPVAISQAPQTVVKTRDSVRLEANKNDTKDQIKPKIKAALEAAAQGETDALLKETMEDWAKRDDLLGLLADEVLRWFQACSPAVTIPILRVELEGQNVTIGVVNVQVFTPNPSDQLKKHEDGHSFINDEVAKRLGAAAANRTAGQENRREAIKKEILGGQDKAHGEYERATENGTKGNQKEEAEKATNKVVKQILGDWGLLPVGGTTEFDVGEPGPAASPADGSGSSIPYAPLAGAAAAAALALLGGASYARRRRQG